MTETPATAIWRGRFLVIAAAVLWSSSGFFAKAPIFADWPIESRGMMLACWRAIFASLILAFFVRRIEWSWMLIPMTVAYAGMNWTYLNALVLCEPTLAIWLQYSAPAWVFLIGWVVLRERPMPRDWLLLLFAATGVGIILWAELGGASPIGVRYGLGSGFFFALVVITIRLNRGLDAAWLVFLNNAVTAVALAPVLVNQPIWPHGEQWTYLVAFGMLQMGIPYALFAHAVRSVSSHEASGLTLLEPILVPVWVFAAWHNSPDYQFPAVTTLIGGGLILAGLVLRYRKVKKKNNSPCDSK